MSLIVFVMFAVFDGTLAESMGSLLKTAYHFENELGGLVRTLIMNVIVKKSIS